MMLLSAVKEVHKHTAAPYTSVNARLTKDNLAHKPTLTVQVNTLSQVLMNPTLKPISRMLHHQFCPILGPQHAAAGYCQTPF